MTEKVSDAARRQTVQSAEVGTEVLKALARLGLSASLSQLADAANMPASKAHRYLKALIASGFAEQDPQTGRYRLGSEALFLGIAALGRIDVVAAAAAPMAQLHNDLNETCILVVWANHGPTVVKVIESPAMVPLVTRLGTVMPMTLSATGLIFSAFLPASQTGEVLRREAVMGPPVSAADRKAAEARIKATRALGLAIVESLNFPGVSAVAAPVLGVDGALMAAVCALGPAQTLDTAPDGRLAAAVRETARQISARVGYRPQLGQEPA